MDMTMKRTLLILILLTFMMLFSACRIRTTGVLLNDEIQNVASGINDKRKPEETAHTSSTYAEDLESGMDESLQSDERANRTKENQLASRKEYDDRSQAEIMPGSDRLLYSAGEGSGKPVLNNESALRGDHISDHAEFAAIQTAHDANAEQMGISEEAEEADSALTYYSVLLEERTSSLFECQRANVYWETEQDYVTIHKTSQEHAMILKAGAYDVSARLQKDHLLVDAGWVFRKNPQVIVKVVDRNVLGSLVQNTLMAEHAYRTLQMREQWELIDAVQKRHILLISEELMSNPYLQTAAMLMIAKTSSPDIMKDVDIEEALDMLMEECMGRIHTGIMYYSGNDI